MNAIVYKKSAKSILDRSLQALAVEQIIIVLSGFAKAPQVCWLCIDLRSHGLCKHPVASLLGTSDCHVICLDTGTPAWGRNLHWWKSGGCRVWSFSSGFAPPVQIASQCCSSMPQWWNLNSVWFPCSQWTAINGVLVAQWTEWLLFSCEMGFFRVSSRLFYWQVFQHLQFLATKRTLQGLIVRCAFADSPKHDFWTVVFSVKISLFHWLYHRIQFWQWAPASGLIWIVLLVWQSLCSTLAPDRMHQVQLATVLQLLLSVQPLLQLHVAHAIDFVGVL